MNSWTDIDCEERAARRLAWVAAHGDVRRWRQWLDDGGGRMCDALGSCDELASLRGDNLLEQSERIDAIDPGSDDYPDRIATDVRDPGLLWIEGSIPDGRTLAVVGTRSVDFEGIRLGREIVRDIAATGVIIASGGARGVDTVAHEAALSAGAPTVAFVPGGLSNLTPRSNLKLFRRIPSHGALVTEYPEDTGPRKYHFRRRNELIAAHADAVLVIRSKARGGTMLTARAAQRLARPLFVVPGSPEDETSQGCLMLIREGAQMIRHARDLLEDMGWDRPDERQPTQVRLDVSASARHILNALEGVAAPDELARRTDVCIADVRVALLELEMAGYVEKRPGSAFYRRTER